MSSSTAIETSHYFPEKVSLAMLPTPLQRLNYGEDIKPEIRLWCKRDDLTGSLLTGNKVRKLEYVVATAKHRGADTLVTCGGLQSNHCRATALVAAREGLQCRLILRGDPLEPKDGNFLLSDIAGADIYTYPASTYHRSLPSLLKEHESALKDTGRHPYIIPTGASDGVGIWGYLEAARELAEDFVRHSIKAPLVVCAAGSGGTLAGLACGLTLFAPEARVLGVAVCDNAAYFEKRLRDDIDQANQIFTQARLPMPSNFTIVDDYIGPGYAKGYPQLFSLIRGLAASDGIVLDPVYTAKAFWGLLSEQRLGKIGQRDIVFVHTGGVFGVFPFKDSF